ncbi:MAG: hypothetical protein U9O24_06260 [Campylobacterota bacterium]|nr:hypothetical protein [Campylobacterota bacterium]
MIQPEPFKFVCPKCGYSEIVRPKSDALTPMEFMRSCPKCNITMEKTSLTQIENILGKVFGK